MSDERASSSFPDQWLIQYINLNSNIFRPGNLRGGQPSYAAQSNYAAQPNYAQQPAPQAYTPQAQPAPQPQQPVPDYNNYNNVNYVAQYQPTTANPRVHHPGQIEIAHE